MPESPTLGARARSKPSKQSAAATLPGTSSLARPCTPPRSSTPRNRSGPRLSPVRTPLSHKGLHMSPTASLAYHKTHVEPPSPFLPDGGINPAVFGTESVRTPSRRRSHGHRENGPTLFPPVTPRRLVYPVASSSAESPSRTPGSRSIFDPHDPSALLDEELARLGAKGLQESPVGLFEGRRGLLYESPSIPSPGKLPRWF